MCAHLTGITTSYITCLPYIGLYYGTVEFVAQDAEVFVCDESLSSQLAFSSFTYLTGSDCMCARWTVCRQMFWAVRIQANMRASGTW